jgi:hypothetical protein
MTTCANCSNEAFFAYQITAEFSIPYCSKHIPKFLSSPASSHRLVKIEAAALKPAKKKAEPEPVVLEEPVIEEAPVEELIDEGELEVEEGS